MFELSQQVKLIKNRDDFIEFVRRLADYLQDHPSAQSDLNVISYLHSIAAWTGDMDGYYQNHKEEPPVDPTWKMIGEIIIASLSYE